VGHPEAAHPALLDAVYLLGSLHDLDLSLVSSQPLMDRALARIEDFGVGSPLHLLQAHILLGAYNLKLGALLSGRIHLSRAASLARSLGLHAIRSSRTSQVIGVLDVIQMNILPEPLDQVDEGERINAFWTIFALERLWGFALGSPAQPRDGNGDMNVDCPWPLTMEQYDNVIRFFDSLINR
jgi:hypothetical protein